MTKAEIDAQAAVDEIRTQYHVSRELAALQRGIIMGRQLMLDELAPLTREQQRKLAQWGEEADALGLKRKAG